MRMYHVGFALRPNKTKQDRIDAALNTIALDWMRYSSHAWIVYAGSADAIHIAVREAIDDGDQFLVLPIDMEAARQGLLSGWIWEWLNIDRSQPNWGYVRDQIRERLRPPPPLQPPLSLEEILKNYNKFLPPGANKD